VLKKLTYICLGLAVVVACVCFFAWSTIVRAAVQEALSSIRASGARIGWTGVEVNGTEVGIRTFDVWVPGPPVAGGIRPPIQVEFQDAKVAVPIGSVLTLAPVAHWSVSTYGGRLEGTASALTEIPQGNIRIDGVDLGQHPQIRALGLDSAVISGRIDDAVFAQFPASKGVFDLQASKISIPKYPEQFALLRLPPIADAAIVVKGCVGGGVVDATSVRLSSTLLEADGRVKFVQPLAGGKNTCEGSFKVSLTDGGMEVFALWLPIISGNSLTSGTRTFEIRLTGVECLGARPAPGRLVLGDMCISTRFIPAEG